MRSGWQGYARAVHAMGPPVEYHENVAFVDEQPQASPVADRGIQLWIKAHFATRAVLQGDDLLLRAIARSPQFN